MIRKMEEGTKGTRLIGERDGEGKDKRAGKGLRGWCGAERARRREQEGGSEAEVEIQVLKCRRGGRHAQGRENTQSTLISLKPSTSSIASFTAGSGSGE